MWWQQRDQYDLFVSEVVLQEASRGDPDPARRRVEAIAGITILRLSEAAEVLAETLLAQRLLPTQAVLDALHIGLAAANGMDYLLTWNCRHIANATTRLAIENLCRRSGYNPQVICTPEELIDQ